MSNLIGVIEFNHLMMQRYANKAGIAVDMTLGNGHDSLILCDLFKEVYGFDIQQQALDNSKELLKDYLNMHHILANHADVDQYIKQEVDLIVYNLGYLPGSDQSIVTKDSSTIRSMEKGLALLKKKGLMLITVYVGHESAKNEVKAVDNFIEKLDNSIYHISCYKIVSSVKAPYVYCIHKKKQLSNFLLM